MTEEFDPYAGFVGLSLDSLDFVRYGVTFHVSGKVKEECKRYKLNASSNIALTEEEIFNPKTELDFARADTNTTNRLFSFLGQKIVEFKPLRKSRACKLRFSNGEIYIWENEDAIVDNLFIVTDISSGTDGAWWLIDDR